MKYKEKDLKFLIIGLLLSMIMSIIFIVIVINNTQHTTYGDSYKSIQELRKNLTYNITLPSFIERENNLKIGNIDGGVFSIANENFRLCGCEYNETFKNDDKYFRLCPLGFYEKINDDRLYSVNSEDENFSLLRIRQGKDYTIFNYLYDDIAYGCITFEKISDEKVLALVNIKAEDLSEITLVQEDDIIENSSKNTDTKELALNTLLDSNKNIKKLGNTEDLTYYAIGDQTVLIIANKDFNKYIKELGNTCDFSIIDNELWLYNTKLEKEFNGNNLNYYKYFLLTMDNILKSYN